MFLSERKKRLEFKVVVLLSLISLEIGGAPYSGI